MCIIRYKQIITCIKIWANKQNYIIFVNSYIEKNVFFYK